MQFVVILVLTNYILCIRPKNKLYKVNVLAPTDYINLYQQSHASLGTDLITIAMAFETAFNNSTMAKSNGYSVSFLINSPIENPILARMKPELCDGSTNSILDLLNEINVLDNTHHYIALIPCMPSMFSHVFESVGVNVPVIDYSSNIECAKRIAIFFEVNYQHLFSSFSNALLKIMNAPASDYITITESSLGDEGLRSAITINDNTVYHVLNNKCFLNTPGMKEIK